MRHRLAGRVAAICTALLTLAAASSAQPVRLTGKVVSDAGSPLPLVAITIPSLRLVTISREDGTYSITISGAKPTAPVVVNARRVGFRPATATVSLSGASVTQDFVLETSAVRLTGIVVSALSISREKATIGTSQQAITGEALTNTRDLNIVNSLSGKVSGVTIQGSGNIGGSSRIVIRGAGSITGNNQPLFVVDGMPVSNDDFSTVGSYSGRDYGNGIADINPDDIASMTVLKGPNAAALYGSRASNGAIVISTKSGRFSGDGVKFTVNSYATSDQFSVMPKYQNRYGQGFGGEFKFVDGAGAGVNDGADESWGPLLDGRLIDQFTGKAQPWVAHPNNVSNYFQRGYSISNNLNVVAGGQRASARLSVTRDNTQGIVPNSGVGKLSGVLTASADVNDKLTVSGTLQSVQTRGLDRPEVGYTEGNPFMTFTWFGRQVDMNALKQTYFQPDGSLYNWNYNYHRNPYWQVFDNGELDTRDRLIAQASANYAFTPWLKGLVRVGSDGYRNTAEEHFAPGNIDRADPAYNGGFSNDTRRASESNIEGLLTATRTVGKLDATVNVGGNMRRNDFYQVTYNTSGILVAGIYNLANAGIPPTFTNNEQHSGVNSTYGSAVLTWNQWWTVEVTGRNDWSSTLPKANASYFYPSVSTSLLLSDLFPSITRGGWLGYVKLRGGWAQVGADADPYQLRTNYIGNSNKFAGQPLFTLSNTSANPTLKPERTTGVEGGAEVSFLQDRVTIDATYYKKQTKDQIIRLTVPPASGFSARAINAGQVTNAGFELLLTARPVKLSNGFEWTTTFNYARNRNKVDALLPGLNTYVLGSNWNANIEARVGQPWGILFGTAWLRDSATGKVMTSGGLPVPDPVRRVLGNVNPDWSGGISNEFRYRNYTLNVLFDMRVGGKNFSSGNWFGNYSGILASSLKGREINFDNPGIVVDGIDVDTKKPNTTKVIAEDYYHNWFYANEDGIYPTGFVKLRELRFTWDVPSSSAQRLRLSALRVALVGRNLWTSTKFPNYDSENLTRTSNVGQGFDMGALPTVRSFGLNLSLTP